MGILKGLKPEGVFGYFEEISAIPRGSGNMKAIADYCVEFAKARNLEHYRDDMHNVIIVKEGTPGYENSDAIIIQGHLDMVCEKTPESTIDFTKDGIEICMEGDRIFAKGTTLGGDNGIAIAMALALLDADDIEHPRIEAVFTVDEETGLYGAEAIDVSMLKAKKFLNLDSEDEGVITVSCAGGITGVCRVPLEKALSKGKKIKVVIDGLLGGHSGIEINRGRANSNILMGRFMYEVAKEVGFHLIQVNGGKQDNAITKKTEVEIVLKGEESVLKKVADRFIANVRTEYATPDPDIAIHIENLGDGEFSAFDEASTEKVAALLLNFPNGITAMSMDIEGLVETSLNLGILETRESELLLVTGMRSAKESAKMALADRVISFVKLFGGETALEGNYPGWAYKADSKLRETVIEVYKQQTGKEPIIEAIHAGLECGLFTEKIEDLDCVSIGPDLRDVHTVDEWMSISSVQRTWELVLGILKASK